MYRYDVVDTVDLSLKKVNANNNYKSTTTVEKKNKTACRNRRVRGESKKGQLNGGGNGKLAVI